MILLEAFYQSVEFYVVCCVVAAAVLGVCVRPSRREAVVTYLLEGELEYTASDTIPSLFLRSNPDRTVTLIRRGIECIGLDGAVSLAVSVNGFDIDIRERIVPGYSGQDQMINACFKLDFMGSERYHIRYESDDTGYFTAFTFGNFEGVEIERQLRQ